MLEEIPIPPPVSPTKISHQNEFDIYNYDKSLINQDLWPVGETNVQTMISNFLEKKEPCIKLIETFLQ